MASKGAVLPLLRRELHTSRTRLTRAASSFSIVATTVRNTRAVSTRHSARHTALFSRRQLLGQTRPFSQSLSTRLTDEDDRFDPRQVERESDEVDVCIVGGGKGFRVCQLFVVTHRLVPD
jgi:electron-transferring-flavoprotein dehydrogenase